MTNPYKPRQQQAMSNSSLIIYNFVEYYNRVQSNLL